MVDISVIIPVYNVQDYLRDCIESLLRQEKKNLEIILVDDGSTDNSGDICDEYEHKNINIKVIHKKNGGLGSARNAGFKAATGEYIYYLDSDDWIVSETLESIYEIAKRENLDILLFGAKCFWDGEGCFSKDWPEYYKHDIGIGSVQKGIDNLKETFYGGQYIASLCLRLIRRDFLRNLKIEFNENIIHEDEDYAFLTYIQAERVMCIPDIFYQRRYRKGSIVTSEQHVKSAEGRYFAFNRVMDFYEKDLFTDEDNIVCLRQCEIYLHDVAEKQWMTFGEEREVIIRLLKGMIKRIKGVKNKTEFRTRMLIVFPSLFSWMMFNKKKFGTK